MASLGSDAIVMSGLAAAAQAARGRFGGFPELAPLAWRLQTRRIMTLSRSLALATTLAVLLIASAASAESAVAFRCGLTSISSTEITVPANVPALPFVDQSVGMKTTQVSGTATPPIVGMGNPLALETDSVPPFGAGWLLRLSSPMTEGQRYTFEVGSECDGGGKAIATSLKVLAGPPAALPRTAGTLSPLPQTDGTFVARFVPSSDFGPFLPVARYSVSIDGVRYPSYGAAYGPLGTDLYLVSPRSPQCGGKVKGDVVSFTAELTAYIAGVAEPLPPVSIGGTVVCDPTVAPPMVIRDAGDEKTTSGDEPASTSSNSSSSGGCVVASSESTTPWAIGLALPVLGLLLRRRRTF